MPGGWNKGKKLSEEHKKKLSIIRSGENSHLAKLTWEKVNEIRMKYATGNYTHRQLALEYETDKSVTLMLDTALVKIIVFPAPICPEFQPSRFPVTVAFPSATDMLFPEMLADKF